MGSFFQNFLGGGPPNPPCGRGKSPPTSSPTRRFAPARGASRHMVTNTRNQNKTAGFYKSLAKTLGVGGSPGTAVLLAAPDVEDEKDN